MAEEIGQATEEPEGLDENAELAEYPLDSLQIRMETRTIFEVVRRIQKDFFIMDPDFQREFVWPEEKQSRLVESVLMRIPLPVIYLAETADARLVVVDGLQRLTTFQRFLEGHLKLELKNEALSGRTFSQLEPKLQNRIEDTPLILYLIDSKAPERARLDIFERVNGGQPLTRQQMRNALYQGKATRLLRDLAADPTFREATGRSLSQKAMRDREAINRFCAFHLLGSAAYKDEMDDFLAEALVQLNKLSDKQVEEIRARFLRSMRNNLAVFGRHAFRKHERGQQNRKTFNMSLFDVCSTLLARYDEATVAAKKDALHEGFYELIANADFSGSVTYGTSDRQRVLARFRLFEKLLNEVLGAV